MRHIEQLHKRRARLRLWFALSLIANFMVLPFFIGRMMLIQYAWESDKWPSVQGTMLEFFDYSDNCSYEQLEQWRSILCNYAAKYEYTVDGIRYEGHRIAYLGSPRWTDIRFKWSKDSPAEVFYNPNDPSVAVLFPGYQYYPGGRFVVGVELMLGLIVIGVLLWFGSATLFAELDPDIRPEAYREHRLKGNK